MIVALKPGVTQESREQLMDWLQNLGLHIHVSEGEYQTILGLVGDTTKGGYGSGSQSRHWDSVKAGHGAVQVLQPQISPGGYRGRGRRCEDRRRKLLRHGRSLLRGI